jgi:hypothetical protein
LTFETVEESLSGHFFRVFGEELIDYEVIVIGAFEVERGGWGRGDVGAEDGAIDVIEGIFGFGEAEEGANLVV